MTLQKNYTTQVVECPSVLRFDLTQNGYDEINEQWLPPTIVWRENTFGVTPTFEALSEGKIRIFAEGQFPVDKMEFFPNNKLMAGNAALILFQEQELDAADYLILDTGRQESNGSITPENVLTNEPFIIFRNP